MLYTLLTDGSSDKALLYILNWLLAQLSEEAFTSQWADLRGLPNPPSALALRIRTALDYYPCDLLFVHRDAERESIAQRTMEIRAAVGDLQQPPVVCVVPVRMQEAWLLFNEPALRRAAGCPNGGMILQMPVFVTIENAPNPKRILHDLLREASNLTGRRAKGFRPALGVHRLAELIEDFEPLRQLPAFCTMEQELRKALTILGCLKSACKDQHAVSTSSTALTS